VALPVWAQAAGRIIIAATKVVANRILMLAP
jgi:hypothetical protein